MPSSKEEHESNGAQVIVSARKTKGLEWVSPVFSVIRMNCERRIAKLPARSAEALLE